MKTQKKLLDFVAIIVLALIATPGCGDKNKSDSAAPLATPAAPSAPSPTAPRKDENGGKSSETTRLSSFSYWLIRNGCSTEKQTFASQEALCKGLQNRDLNKNCALDRRQEEFKKVGCVGEFIETTEIIAANNTAPSPVHCFGRVSGQSGEKKIDQTIPWDRKKIQKIVLSEFTDLKDAGEYSVILIPYKNLIQPGAIKIFGWFIDNNKNQIIEGRLESGVYFYHKDSQLNGREVEIKCEIANQKLAVPNYANEAKLDMICLGSTGSAQGKKDHLNTRFSWDQRTPKRESLMIKKDGKEIMSNIQILVEINKETGIPTLRASSNSIEGHVELTGQTEGRLELGINYLSAWDDRLIDIDCSPTKVWDEKVKMAVEKMRNEKQK